jgi:Na+/proline symporter
LAVDEMVKGIHDEDEQKILLSKDKIKLLQEQESLLRDSVKSVIVKAIPNAKADDRDYIFLNFVLNNLPHGVIGLLLAIIFLAAMSSMAGELNALTSTTSVDVYKRSINKNADPYHYLVASRWFTVMWAVLAMIFAMLANFAENLIQFVNIVGSIFYGTILGIFLVAFYIKRVGGTAVFWAAIISEATVLYCYFFTGIAFLLYNIIGCGMVVVVSLLIQSVLGKNRLA